MKNFLLLIMCLFTCTTAIAQKKLFLSSDSQRTEIFAGKKIIISLTPQIVIRQWVYFREKAIVKDIPRKVRAGMTVEIARFDPVSRQWITPKGETGSNFFKNRKIEVSIANDSIRVVFRRKCLKTKLPDES